MSSTSSVDEDFQRETCANEPVYYNCSIAYAAEPPYPACQCAYVPASGATSETCSSQGMLTCPYDSASDFICCPSGTGYVLTDSTGTPQCLSDPQSACLNDPLGRCPTECI